MISLINLHALRNFAEIMEVFVRRFCGCCTDIGTGRAWNYWAPV